MIAHDTLIAELTAIAYRPGALLPRATALLVPLQAFLRYDGLLLSLLDPEQCRYQPLVRDGSPSPENGLVILLHAGDGSRLGLLCLSFRSATPVPAALTGLLPTLIPLIAHAVDPRPSLLATAALVTTPTAGLILTRAGATEPFPGLPTHPLLRPASPAVTEARLLLGSGATQATYLVGTAMRYTQVTVLSTRDIPPGHRIGVVLLSAPHDLRDLTHHELTLLGLRLAGRRRRPTHDTIATMNRIRRKLGVSTRNKALLYAAAHGLYLPAPAYGDP